MMHYCLHTRLGTAGMACCAMKVPVLLPPNKNMLMCCLGAACIDARASPPKLSPAASSLNPSAFPPSLIFPCPSLPGLKPWELPLGSIPQATEKPDSGRALCLWHGYPSYRQKV